MSFPWLSEINFDDGTRQTFDSTTDASSILSFPDYIDLSNAGMAPWRGAHCMRAKLNGTAVAFIQETGDYDTTLTSTIWNWFTVCIGSDLALSTSSTVVLMQYQSAGNVPECVVGVRNNAGVYELFCGQNSALRTLPIVPNSNKWYQIEVKFVPATATAGTIDFYVDGAQVGAQITGITNIAISEFDLGPVSGTSAGDKGTILWGAAIADDARIYPRERFPLNPWVTKDMSAFVGQGRLDSVVVTGTGTDGVIALYDTDIFFSTSTAFSREPALYVRQVVANDFVQATMTFDFKRGVYAQITGTNVQAHLSLQNDPGTDLVVLSQAQYINRGQKRGSR